MTPGRPGQRPERQPGSGIVIARPFGIPVHVSPYWFVIAGVFIVIYANDLAGTVNGNLRYVVAALFVVLLYLSVLAHELSHSIVARSYGLPVRRILLYPLGGLSEIEREPQTPGREFAVSAAGPALSLVLAAIGYELMQVVPGGIGWKIVRLFWWANLFVGLFNLLPGLPLDGGRMLRAVAWKITGRPASATVAAAWAGRMIAVALLAAALALTMTRGQSQSLTNIAWLGAFTASPTSMVWWAVIAAFMWMGAGQSIRATRLRERLPGIQARRLARKAIPIPASLPLAEAIRRADETNARALVVVDHENSPIAIVNESAVMATPPQRRPW
ncbi:MAG TPA: site-2 protease family protein, partial [Streptosporangiaceae bacterium]|nr:site-2 protease family protein [Streptosporangiaceae bacterium]